VSKHLFTLAIISLLAVTVSAQVHSARSPKVSKALQNALAVQTSDSVDIVCTVINLGWLQEKRVRILAAHRSSNTAVVRLPNDKVQDFLSNNAVQFADTRRKATEELTTGALDISLNKINFVHHLFPGINGNGINISIKEQLLDSTDIDWQGRYFNSGVASEAQTTHASIMATMVAGAGNSSPYALGAAPAANITSSSFAVLLPDADSFYRNANISVQNHSYGTAIENYYGSDARAYDMNVYANPWLVHVFSAGNSGTSASTQGTYAGVEGFANLTGSFKMAKNIIAVGAVDSFNQVMAPSSKGPTYDGRIQPALVTFGQDGSSGAAALVSGTAALLQQQYKMKNGVLPSASLIRAVLYNSSDDVGAAGIDFSSGYGSLNAYNAVKTIDENRFFEYDVAPGESTSFSINVPAQVQQLKLTIAWTDTAAAANAPKALINDIDMQLTQKATGQQWMPWILNSAPQSNALQSLATRGIDTLNTAEQITINNPEPGEYTIQVSGSHVVSQEQRFCIAYQFDTLNSFVWTYPTASDPIEACAGTVVRWQTNRSEPARVEYSYDGMRWQYIADVDLSQQYAKWQTPDTNAVALLRLKTSSGILFQSDSFVVSHQMSIKVGFNCVDSFLLGWSPLPGVLQYRVYTLGQKYMEPIMTVTDTSRIFQKQDFGSLFYAVAPIVLAKEGVRSYAVNYTIQGVDCYLKTFYASLFNNKQAVLSGELGSLYNVASVAFQQLTTQGFVTIRFIDHPTSTASVFQYDSLKQGINYFRMLITLVNGQQIVSGVDKVYYFPANPVLVFPNPARQNQLINIITNEPGKYTIHLFSAAGLLIKKLDVNNILEQVQPLTLPAGMYFLKLTGYDGSQFMQKLVVF
jgi:hypothetical protein